MDGLAGRLREESMPSLSFDLMFALNVVVMPKEIRS